LTTWKDERLVSRLTPRLSCAHTSDSELLRKLQNAWRAKVAHPGTGRRLARQLVPAGDLKQFSSGRVQTRSRHDSHSHTESYRRLCCRTRCYSRGPHHRSVREASDYTVCLLPHLRVPLARHLYTQDGTPDSRHRRSRHTPC